MDNRILNLEQAAVFLNISVKTLIKLLKEEHIPARKLGREWRFSSEHLIKWLSEGDSNDYSNQSEIYVSDEYHEQSFTGLISRIRRSLDELEHNNNIDKIVTGAPDVSVPDISDLNIIYKQKGDAEKLEFKISWLNNEKAE